MNDPAGVQLLWEGVYEAWDLYLLRSPIGGARPELTTPLDTPEEIDYLNILQRAVQDEHLLEAIALASPSLAGLLGRVAEGDTSSLKRAQLRRAAFAALRYDLRMRTRPTPFGLFAGVACGDFRQEADPECFPRVSEAGSQLSRTQVDMQWLMAVVRNLEAEAARSLPSLRVHAHPALMVRGDRIVLECASTFGAAPTQNSRARVSVRYSAPVRRALDLSVQPVELDVLIGQLTEEFGTAARGRVLDLVQSLIAEEVLLTEMRPALDGTDSLAHVVAVLEAVQKDNELPPVVAQRLAELHELRERIIAYDQVPVGSGRPTLVDTIARARQVYDHPTPLHVDSRLGEHTELPKAVAEEVERAAELMWRMSTPKLGLHALRDYHPRFLERYGTDRLVPLLDLLDGNVGLGPPAGYSWPNSEIPIDQTKSDPDSTRDRVLHRLLADALRSGRREVELDESTVRDLCRDTPNAAQVPNSCEITVQITAPSAQQLAAGEFQIHLSPSPGSHHAGSTLARFSGALGADYDERLHAASAALPTHVENAFRADIAFLPRSGKAANLAHTVPDTTRRISVGVFDSSGAEEIRLTDIGVCATQERLCAVHRPTGQEITPVLANMVSAPAQAPNAARLLWEIGLEGQRLWEPWKWGSLANSPFVPRIRFGRFVLAPAVWRLDEPRAAPQETAWADAVAQWRARHEVPRHVLVVSNDQRFALDLDHPWHIELLRAESRKDPEIVVHEVPGEYEGWMDSDTPGHTNEVVVPLQRRKRETRRRATAAYQEPRHAPHGVGGDWVYLKLYGTARSQDDLLRNRIGGLVDAAREHGVDRWFFLRYTDPDGHHLRLRLHGDAHRLWSDVVPRLGATLLDWQRQGLLRAHRIDQYDPEYERYGGVHLMPTVEGLFQADSATAIDLLTVAADPACPYDLDTLAAVSVAALANAFGPPTPEAGQRVHNEPAEAWLGNTGTRHDLPERYRSAAGYWAGLIDPVGGATALVGDVVGDKVLACLRGRDEQVVHTRSEMDRLRTENACHIAEPRLLGSLLHMHCNRLFGGDSTRERDVIGLARGAVQDNAKRRRYLR